MPLPKFHYNIQPTTKKEWLRLWERRPLSFWWHVAYVIKDRRVRHNNHEKIQEICAEIDAAFPNMKERVHVKPISIYPDDLPRLELVSRSTFGRRERTTRRSRGHVKQSEVYELPEHDMRSGETDKQERLSVQLVLRWKE